MSAESLNITVPGNWFDGVVIVVLIIGLLRGRKKGMSGELLPLFQWLAVLVVGSLYYEKLGRVLAHAGGVTDLFGFVAAYLLILGATVFVFTAVKRAAGEKLVGSDLFGRLEFYLGMLAGMCRFFCYVLVLMALMNGPVYTKAELEATAKKQRDNFGSISFPTFGQIQFQVLRGSLTGDLVGKHLSEVLIKPTSTAPPGARKRPTLGEQKTRELERTMNPK